MNILVIGGTEFVGRHIVERALLLGHRVTVFHRGKHGAELFAEAEHVLGDRDGGLAVLGDGPWDVVIDTCGYVPRLVRQSVDYLKDKAHTYLFISTISVYAEAKEPGQDEDGPLATLADSTTEVIDWETYGGLKVLCEEAVREGFGDRALLVRPGMIVGPYDKTDRFTYWFRRAGKGGKMLSLCERDEPVQFIDGRDLAAFCIHLLDAKTHGVFNATGPDFNMTWGDIFDEAALQANTSYEIVRPTDAWIEEKGIEVGKSFPAQFRSRDGFDAMYQLSVQRGIENGLRFRGLAEVVRDTLAWRGSVEEELKVGMSAEEEELLIREYEGAEV